MGKLNEDVAIEQWVEMEPKRMAAAVSNWDNWNHMMPYTWVPFFERRITLGLSKSVRYLTDSDMSLCHVFAETIEQDDSIKYWSRAWEDEWYWLGDNINPLYMLDVVMGLLITSINDEYKFKSEFKKELEEFHKAAIKLKRKLSK
jgi:hypothetical protein